MPRSTKDSDDESWAKTGQRKRSPNLTSAVVNSPLRRSLRVLKANKQNDTSPESVASDVSGVQTRVTRRRAGTMESNASESHKLRSRKNSVSSEASETAETEAVVGTPSKRVTRGSGATSSTGDTPKRSRRFTRAGSETKSSPPLMRTTRKIRANSAEPESIKDIRNLHLELPSTPTKRRSRASRRPSESSVMEEVEQKRDMEDTVIEVDETDDIELVEVSKQLQVQSKKLDEPNDGVSVGNKVKSAKDNVDKGAPNVSTESSAEIENSMYASDTPSPLDSEAVSKKSELKTETSLKSSMNDEELNNSNKENQNINIIGETIQTNKEIVASTVTLTSPKPFVTDSALKITKEKDRSISQSDTSRDSIKSSDKVPFVETDASNIDNEKSESINLSVKQKSEKSINTTNCIVENRTSTRDDTIEDQATTAASEKTTFGEESVCEKMDVDEDNEIVEKNKTNVEGNVEEEIIDKKLDVEKMEKIDIVEQTDMESSVHEKMDVDDENVQVGQENIDGDTATSVIETEDIVKEKQCSEDALASRENDERRVIGTHTDAKLSNKMSEDEPMEDVSTSLHRTDENKADNSGCFEKDEDKNQGYDKKTRTGESSKSIEIISKEDDRKEAENVPPTKDNEGLLLCETREEHNDTRDRRESVSSIETVVLATLDSDFPKNANENVSKASKSKEELIETDKTVSKEETTRNPCESKNSKMSVDVVDLCVHKNETDLCIAIKRTRSSIVTENDTEATTDALSESKKEERIKKAGESKKEEKSPEKSTTPKESVLGKKEINKNAENVEEAESEKDENLARKESGESKSEKKDNENGSESETNIADLFKNISADEWEKIKPKERKRESENDSDRSDRSDRSEPKERTDRESETDCDLILVDKGAWLAAEKLKAEKEKESFDYDSDDTVVIKSRLDSLIESEDENVNLSIVKEESISEANDEVTKEDNVEKSPSKLDGSKKSANAEKSDLSLSKSDKSNVSRKLEKAFNESERSKKTPDEIQPLSDEIENPEEIELSRSMTSGRKRATDIIDSSKNEASNVSSAEKSSTLKGMDSANKESNDSKKKTEKEDADVETSVTRVSSTKTTNANSNVSERLIDGGDNDGATIQRNVDVVVPPKSSSKKKLLSKRRRIGSNAKESTTSSSSTDENVIIIKRRSLNVSDKKGSARKKERDRKKSILSRKDEDGSSSNESSNESTENHYSSDNEESETSSNTSKTSKSKKKNETNFSTLARVDSDSEIDMLDIYPKFLHGSDVTSSEEDERKDKDEGESSNDKSDPSSIDSDIEREYNLRGKDISKYSDDNVPGDECRASESEYSDPDDNGSDLADFVVDDDEVEEGNEEEENENQVEVEEEGELEVDSESEKDEETEKDKIEDDKMSVDGKFSSEAETEVGTEGEEASMEKEEKAKGKKEKHDEELSSKLSEVSPDRKKSKKATEQLSLSLRERNKIRKEKNYTKNVSFESSLSKGKRFPTSERQHDFEKRLNESDLAFMQKVHKLQGSIECSTPKAATRNIVKVATNVCRASPLTSENEKKTEVNNIPSAEQAESTSKMKKAADESLSKLDKISKESKSKNSTSLPTNSSESMKEKANEKVLETNEMHRTMVTPSDDLTLKYLRKTRLNESAPTITWKEDSLKSRKKSVSEEFEDAEMEKEADVTAIFNVEKKREKSKTIDEFDENKKENEDDNAAEDTPRRIQRSPLASVKTEDANASIEKKKKRKKTEVKSTEWQEVEFKRDIAANEDAKKAGKKKGKAKFEEKMGIELICENDLPIKKKKKKTKERDMEEKEEEVLTEVSSKPKKKEKKKVEIESAEWQVEQFENIFEDANKDAKKASKKKGKSKIVQTMKYESVCKDDLSTVKEKRKKQRNDKEEIPMDVLPEMKKKKKKKKKKITLNVDQQIQEQGSVPAKKSRKQKVPYDSDEPPEAVAFSKARIEALEAIKRATDSIKANEEMKKKKHREHIERVREEKEAKEAKESKVWKIEQKKTVVQMEPAASTKTNLKRFPEDILEILCDEPVRPKKKRKLQERNDGIRPSRNTSADENVNVKDDYSQISSYGSTTHFDVIDLKVSKQTTRKQTIANFRQRLFSRNSRHPVSSYMMYLQKQKRLGNN